MGQNNFFLPHAFILTIGRVGTSSFQAKQHGRYFLAPAKHQATRWGGQGSKTPRSLSRRYVRDTDLPSSPSRLEPTAPPATGARRCSVEEKTLGGVPKQGSLTGVHEARSISERLTVDAGVAAVTYGLPGCGCGSCLLRWLAGDGVTRNPSWEVCEETAGRAGTFSNTTDQDQTKCRQFRRYFWCLQRTRSEVKAGEKRSLWHRRSSSTSHDCNSRVVWGIPGVASGL